MLLEGGVASRGWCCDFGAVEEWHYTSEAGRVNVAH